jgi:MFS family permease
MLAWIVGAAWMYLTTGAVFTRFAKLLGMPKFGYGLLAALPFAGALAQLPVSYFITRYGHRKGLFITFGVIHRGLWLAVAAIPWVLPPGWQWQGLVVLFALTSMTGQMVTPIWVSWMADLVPSQIRGRYFSRRSQLGQFIGVIVTLLMGFVLDRAEIRGAQVLLQVLCLALGLGGIYGIADFLFFVKVPDVQRIQPDPAANFLQMLRTPLQDRNFLRFLGFTTTLTFATGYVAQFVWLYIFDVAKMNNTEANVMLVLMPLVILLIFGPIWGRAVDRFGRKPVLLLAGLLIVPGSVGWLVISREHWVLGYLPVVISTAAWPGYEIANFNLFLSLSEGSTGRASSNAYIAINSTACAFAGILSGLFGGAVAQTLGDWHTTILGVTITYHGVLFIISSGIRVVALLWLVGFQDTATGTPHAALRYLGTNLYSNLQQAIFIPGRLLQQLSRWTYQINKRRD